MSVSASAALRWLGGLVILAGLVLASLGSIRIYMADRLAGTATIENLEKAVRLAPAYASAWAQLGSLLDKRGDSASALKALQRAVALNPYDARAWIDMGLLRELANEPQGAEQCFRRAVQVDATFFPRWALANFYLRQGAVDSFSRVLREAIARSRDDLSPAFELCWRAFDDPDEILQKCIPEDSEVDRRYCQFLLQTRRTAAVAGPWKRIEPRLQPTDAGTALTYAEQLLADKQIEPAMRVWNRLCETRILQYQALDPAQGKIVTNGSFLLPPSARVFDWTLTQVDGVTADLESSPRGSSLVIRLSGAHPESAELLSQKAPVEKHRSYGLRFRYWTSGLPDDTGLLWTIEDAIAGTTLASTRPLRASGDEWKSFETAFQTGAATRLIRLVFAYRRSPGTTRSEGSVALADVALGPGEKRMTASGGLRTLHP